MKQQQSQSVVFSIVSPATTGRRAAFTLVELVVAIGILVLMLTMAGSVFSLTLRSTGQATALTDLSQRLRVFEQTLTDDLRNVRRGASKMVIEAHAVNAYWTGVQKDLDANSDPQLASFPGGGDPERTRWDPDAGAIRPELPRADVLMLFTARPGASYIAPWVQSDLQMVLFGHTELGELDPATGGWRALPTAFDACYLDVTLPQVFPEPAEKWHFARRSALLTYTPPSGVPVIRDFGDANELASLQNGAADVVVCTPTAQAGEMDYYSQVTKGCEPLQVPEEWYCRSRLDVTPPVRLADRLGAYLLPNCASFKVEWAFAPTAPVLRDVFRQEEELFWVDPLNVEPMAERLEDIRDRYHDVNAPPPEFFAMDDLVDAFDRRFGGHNPGDPIAWHAEDPAPDLNAGSPPGGTPDPFFPTALRITVDVLDDTGRLERPIRHVIIIPVGA